MTYAIRKLTNHICQNIVCYLIPPIPVNVPSCQQPSSVAVLWLVEWRTARHESWPITDVRIWSTIYTTHTCKSSELPATFICSCALIGWITYATRKLTNHRCQNIFYYLSTHTCKSSELPATFIYSCALIGWITYATRKLTNHRCQNIVCYLSIYPYL